MLNLYALSILYFIYSSSRSFSDISSDRESHGGHKSGLFIVIRPIYEKIEFHLSIPIIDDEYFITLNQLIGTHGQLTKSIVHCISRIDECT